MFTLKLLLAIIFSFQVSTCVLAQVNVTRDAELALDLLHDQINETTTIASTTAINLFFTYLSDISREFTDYLEIDTINIRHILGNLSVIAIDVASGRDCIEFVLNSSGFVLNVFGPDELIAENLINVAQIDVLNAVDQFNDLNDEFLANCDRYERNCEGTSRSVIAEVERLLPSVRRIGFELLTELYIIAYEYTIDLESAHTELMEIYNKAVQNMTLCIASRIAQHEQDPGLPVPSGSVFELYDDLNVTIEAATDASAVTLLSSEDEVMRQNTLDYLDYLRRLSTVISRANNTIQLLVEIAEEYNVTQNCDIPDLSVVANSSIERIENEYQLLVNDTLTRQYARGIQGINHIGREIRSINLEIGNCAADAPCDYLAEKIASRLSGIPFRMQQVTNSTIVLLQQSVTAARESGARVVRDAEEQLEIGLIDLKSCIQSSL